MSTPKCIRKEAVSEEAADLCWATLEEACEKLEPRRKEIMVNVDNFITKNYKKLSPLKHT
jgi:hypothetical protein